MGDFDLGREQNAGSLGAYARAQVDVLRVEEELFVEPADALEELTPCEQAGAAHPIDGAFSRVAILHVAAKWAAAVAVAGVENFLVDLGIPGAYAPPKGRLMLALIQGNPAGTAALRPLSERSCEAKRLYVRPPYRGNGVGRALLARLVQEARTEGYEEMYGDTLKSMRSALRLYSQSGFSEVASYSSSPTPDAIYLKLCL